MASGLSCQSRVERKPASRTSPARPPLQVLTAALSGLACHPVYEADPGLCCPGRAPGGRLRAGPMLCTLPQPRRSSPCPHQGLFLSWVGIKPNSTELPIGAREGQRAEWAGGVASKDGATRLAETGREGLWLLPQWHPGGGRFGDLCAGPSSLLTDRTAAYTPPWPAFPTPLPRLAYLPQGPPRRGR